MGIARKGIKMTIFITVLEAERTHYERPVLSLRRRRTGLRGKERDRRSKGRGTE